jgi:hypothetical protein
MAGELGLLGSERFGDRFGQICRTFRRPTVIDDVLK